MCSLFSVIIFGFLGVVFYIVILGGFFLLFLGLFDLVLAGAELDDVTRVTAATSGLVLLFLLLLWG